MAKRRDITATAKITRPRYSGILLRERLFRRLDGWRKGRAVWVCGPPGAGKTILASSYVDSRSLRGVWYQMDAGDKDPATFFHYMGLAAKSFFPRRKMNLPLLTPECFSNISVFSRRFFEALCGANNGPSFIAFDNYHEVDDPSFDELLCGAMESAPRGVMVVVLSRTGPPPPFARLRANGSLKLLGWEDLRLTGQESCAVLRLKAGQRKDGAARLQRMAAGWAAGLVLMAEAEGNHRGGHAAAPAMETVFEYFESEILGGFDASTRDFLLKTSVLPFMDASMAGALTGSDAASRVLSGLSRTNCFTEKRPHSPPVFQYHPFFREFLRTRLEERFSDGELAAIKGRAAALLAESDDFEEAFALYRDIRDTEGMARMVMARAGALLGQARASLLEQWIRSIPQEAVDSEPWLLYWLGASVTAFNPLEACALFEKAHCLFRGRKDAAGLFLSWSGAVCARFYSGVHLQEMDGWIAGYDSLVEEFGPPAPGMEAVVALAMITGMATRQPTHPRFDYWVERANEHYRESGDVNYLANVVTHQCVRNFVIMADTKVGFASLRGLYRSHNLTPLTAMTFQWIEAINSIIFGRYDECMEAVAEGMRIADSTGIYLVAPMLLGHGAISSLNNGDFKTADGMLERMAPLAPVSRLVDQSFYKFIMGFRALRRGELKLASDYLDKACEEASETGYLLPECLCLRLLSYVAHRLREHDKAQGCLRAARAIAEKGYKSEIFLIDLLEAHYALDSGDGRKGLELLSRAMSFGRAHGLFATYTWHPELMEWACCHALEAGIEAEYVRELVRRRRITPQSPPLHIDDWPWPVRIYTMGRFGLVANGQPVRFSGKLQKRPLDLLKLLVSLGGRNVSEARVMDLLWPDSGGDAAHRALITTLHRLRRLPGLERAVLSERGSLTLDPAQCWVDVWAFERLLGQAQGQAKDGGYSGGSLACLEKAAAMYQGPFLGGDMDRHWALSTRERLHGRLLRGLASAAEALIAGGRCKDAVPLLLRGIEADPLAESFYQCLMSSYQSMGLRAEGLSVYERLRKNLSGALGIAPSAGTEAIRKTLV